jgi:hypothetical protein
MLCLTYVSRPLIALADRAQLLADIQAVSAARNSMLDITGLLIASPEFFAQVLEGPIDDVEAVMASILADPRHHDIRIVGRSDVATRRFPRWRMAVFDSANFGSGSISPLLAAAHAQDAPHAVSRLDRLIEAIALNGATSKI